MDWHSLIYMCIGVLLGYGFFLGQSAKRKLSASEDEAVRMYAASLRLFAERMSQSARISADALAESEEEKIFRMGMANAQELLASELIKMADKLEG